MKKYLILALFLIMIIAKVSTKDVDRNYDISDLAFANIEALSKPESPFVYYLFPCSRGGNECKTSPTDPNRETCVSATYCP